MPDTSYENAIRQAYGADWWVAGVDEAGRGALAGPVTAASVILPLHQPERLAYLAAVNDSKQLRPAQREALAELIRAHALAWAVASVSAADIDQMGILPATKLAMRLAVAQLQPQPHFLLIDGPLRVHSIPIPQQALVRGDGLSLSIAAASILAKVDRDQQLRDLAVQYPAYGLAQHKGYGTAAHTAALAQHGPTPIHRHTFAPIRQPLV
jgi:ribonuclease HII